MPRKDINQIAFDVVMEAKIDGTTFGRWRSRDDGGYHVASYCASTPTISQSSRLIDSELTLSILPITVNSSPRFKIARRSNHGRIADRGFVTAEASWHTSTPTSVVG